MIQVNVKNRSAEVAARIIEQMMKSENQGKLSLPFDNVHDRDPLTTRERYDASELVFKETGVKIGLGLVENAHLSYRWETI